jgi:hypothetical protein
MSPSLGVNKVENTVTFAPPVIRKRGTAADLELPVNHDIRLVSRRNAPPVGTLSIKKISAEQVEKYGLAKTEALKVSAFNVVTPFSNLRLTA